MILGKSASGRKHCVLEKIENEHYPACYEEQEDTKLAALNT